jgi:esterase/lipase superfamily enzyme
VNITREYHKWHSPILGREMELLVFGHAGPRLLVFPSRKQRFFEYEDHGMVRSLQHAIAAGELQLICVDGLDAENLYCFDIGPEARIERHLCYERYIIEEVLPFSERHNPGTPVTAHGCSFGAYHAVSIALRHPAYFVRALAFSGRYDLTLHVGDFHTLFHGFYSDELCAIMPTHFVPRLDDPDLLGELRHLRFTLVIGEDDPFYENNVELCRAFAEKGIPHELHAWFGNAHRFRYWRQMVRVYL